MNRIGLVACCGKKLDHAAPAQDLYVSPLFQKSRAWVEARCSQWFILSPLHGLVSPLQVIEPYNVRLLGNDAAWGGRVAEQLAVRGLLNARFAILAGEAYVRPLVGLVDLDEVLAGLGIGERLKWLTEAIGTRRAS